jgi:hypothetical protein
MYEYIRIGSGYRRTNTRSIVDRARKISLRMLIKDSDAMPGGAGSIGKGCAEKS